MEELCLTTYMQAHLLIVPRSSSINTTVTSNETRLTENKHMIIKPFSLISCFQKVSSMDKIKPLQSSLITFAIVLIITLGKNTLTLLGIITEVLE